MVNFNWQKYPVYKSYGVEWLEDIPEHWEVIPLTKNISSLADYRGKTPEKTDDGIFLVTTRNVRNGKINYEISKEYVSGEKYLEIMRRGLPKIGDILLTMEAPLGEVANVDFETIALAQRIIKIRTNEKALNPWFTKYFIMSSFFQNQIQKEATGSTAQGIKASKLHKLKVLKPLLSEQQAIANFLDKKIAQIDEYIAKKQRMIELLKEQKTVIINQAVTKGLNPDVPMKYSGIEWLGEIPEHWEISPVKRLAANGYKTFVDGDWVELPYITDKGIRLIQTGNIGIGEYIEKGFRYISEESFYALKCTEVKPNDVLICRLDGPVGRACLAPKLGTKMITSVDNAILKLDLKKSHPQFIVYFMSSDCYLQWNKIISRVGVGKRWRISRNMLGEIKIPVPPKQEQVNIAKYLDKKSEKINGSLATIEKEIKLIQEYRTTLISETVTGKIDVRKYPSPNQKSKTFSE